MGQNKKIPLQKIVKGDLNAFEKLFKNYYEDLCLFAYKYLKDLDLSEQIVQDVFYTFWKNRKTIAIHTSVKSYLYTATKNQCLKEIRSKKYEEQYVSQEKSIPGQYVNTPVDELNAKELNNLIELTLKTLPEKTRQIFTMSRYQGLKYTEIAEKLSISIKTVEARMGKALKAFRKNLTDYQQAS